jgi:hypothetical protein
MFEQLGLYRQGGWGIKRRRAVRARYDREAQRACDRGHSRLGWRRAAAANAAFARGRSAAGRVIWTGYASMRLAPMLSATWREAPRLEAESRASRDSVFQAVVDVFEDLVPQWAPSVFHQLVTLEVLLKGRDLDTDSCLTELSSRPPPAQQLHPLVLRGQKRSKDRLKPEAKPAA